MLGTLPLPFNCKFYGGAHMPMSRLWAHMQISMKVNEIKKDLYEKKTVSF